MHSHKTVKLMYAALFAALIFIGTQFLQIPLPVGYFHFGDCFIIVSAKIVGGPYAIMAAAVGATLADVFSGYTLYAPATFVIKAVMTVALLFILKMDTRQGFRRSMLLTALGAAVAEGITVCGYFLYDAAIYQWAGAVAALPGNLLQGGVAVAASWAILAVLTQSGRFEHIK